MAEEFKPRYPIETRLFINGEVCIAHCIFASRMYSSTLSHFYTLYHESPARTNRDIEPISPRRRGIRPHRAHNSLHIIDLTLWNLSNPLVFHPASLELSAH